MKASPALVVGLAAAASLLSATTASAASTTTVYEAEAFTSTITSGSWAVVRTGTASGLQSVQLNSNGAITFSVPTNVRAFYATVRGTSCAKPGETEVWPTYTFEGHPSYWQEDPYFTGWPGALPPPPATATWGGRTGTGFARITSPPTGWSAPSRFHVDPATITVAFTNDYKGGGCDRNLQIDSLTVIS